MIILPCAWCLDKTYKLNRVSRSTCSLWTCSENAPACSENWGTDPFLLIWLVKVAVMAASGCTPSTTSCCQGPRLTTDTLLLDFSLSPVQHSKQHTNKIVAVKSSLKTLCIIDWSALTHRKWVDSPTPPGTTNQYRPLLAPFPGPLENFERTRERG